MPTESGETRTLYVPRTGTKVLLLVGLALIIAAIYVAVVPLSVTSKSGPNFGCGTGLSPNNDSFGKTYCSAVDSGARYRAVALGVGGIALAGVGAALFGFDTSTRTRTARPGFEDDDDAEGAAPRGRRGKDRAADDIPSDGEVGDGQAPARTEQAADRPVPARTGGGSPARTGGASPAPRRGSVRDPRSGTATRPAHAASDDTVVGGSDPEHAPAPPQADRAEEERSAQDEPQSSLRRPFGDRFADRNRRRVDVDDDDDFDELDGPRSRR